MQSKELYVSWCNCHAGSFGPDFLLIVPHWKDVVTILFPSMSSTTIAPCSILPGIYNGERRVWFWHVYYWTFVFALCCEILKRKLGFTLREIVHKNTTCILFWIRSWTVCCENSIPYEIRYEKRTVTASE